MTFSMNDVPLEDPAVAGVMFRCIKECGRALDKALVESEPLMLLEDWEKLKLGVGHILGNHMHDMWSIIVKKHPQLLSEVDGCGGHSA